MDTEKENPFSLTYSAHMSDAQIQKLWVQLTAADIQKIKARNAVIVTGGKGCGKTHLLRFHSFPLQQMRYSTNGMPANEGVKQDGYIGIYMRCGGLMASRFSGKGYKGEMWETLFEYSLELFLAENLLQTILTVLGDKQLSEDASLMISELIADSKPEDFQTTKSTRQYILNIRASLDYSINNCVFDTSITDTKIRINRGDLLFKVPEIFSKEDECLEDILFIYLIDELENFTETQQKFVNTLMREKSGPTSFKTGIRRYGVKTMKTLSDDEELIEGSEYEWLPLDEAFRGNTSTYRKFSYEILQNRLEQCTNRKIIVKNPREWASDLFETYNTNWDSSDISRIISVRVEKKKKLEDAHFSLFQKNLKKHKIADTKLSEQISKNLRFENFPVLEKVNIINFQKQFRESTDPIKLSQTLRKDCETFIKNTSKSTSTFRTWDHYNHDVIDQLLRDYELDPFYLGIDVFVEMSEGMPRNLINILKHVYNWATFKDRNPLDGNSKTSAEVQQKAVVKASDWAYQDMRKAGSDLPLLKTSISRLANLFKTNHYSDRPSECSLISFATDLSAVSPEARRLITIAENRSLLIRVDKGHKDKNDGFEVFKYRLSKMLCPRWGLPISGGGTKEIQPKEINVIFDPTNHPEQEFRELLAEWQKSRTLRDAETVIQNDLFD